MRRRDEVPEDRRRTTSRRTGRQAEIVEVKGSVELAPLTGLVEAIVDLTATGTTLRENGLVVREEMFLSTARLIANPVAYKLKARGDRRPRWLRRAVACALSASRSAGDAAAAAAGPRAGARRRVGARRGRRRSSPRCATAATRRCSSSSRGFDARRDGGAGAPERRRRRGARPLDAEVARRPRGSRSPTSRSSRTAAVGDDARDPLPQGQRVAAARAARSRRAGDLRARRARPLPVARVVMGVVTARAAGVERDLRRDAAAGRTRSSAAPARCCGVDRGLRDGRRHAVAALAYGTEAVARVDVIGGPGNLYVQEAKRQVSGTSGSTASTAPATSLVIADGSADPRLVALDLLARASTGRRTVVARRPRPARCWTPSRPVASSRPIARRPTRRGRAGRTRRRCTRRWRSRRRSRPSTSSSSGRPPSACAPRVRAAGCVFVGGRRDGVRRLRRGLQPLAADRRRRALRLRRSSPRHVPPAA